MEGFLKRLLDPHDPVSRKALQEAVFYIVRSFAVGKMLYLLPVVCSSVRLDPSSDACLSGGCASGQLPGLHAC